MGWRQVQKLYGIGITYAWDLRQAEDIWLRKNLTVTSWKTAMEFQRNPCIDEDESPIRRTLVSSRSFRQSVHDLSSLEQAVSTFTVRAAERLRLHKLVASGIAVHIRTARHNARCPRDVTGQKHCFQPRRTRLPCYAQHAVFWYPCTKKARPMPKLALCCMTFVPQTVCREACSQIQKPKCSPTRMPDGHTRQNQCKIWPRGRALWRRRSATCCLACASGTPRPTAYNNLGGTARGQVLAILSWRCGGEPA